jgi:aristolochene synthase
LYEDKLIDHFADILEDMSFDDGKKYNDHLMPIMRGDVQPDRSIPVEWMMYDLWDSMRAKDPTLADEILEPTFTFMRAQTDKTRLEIKGMGPYLEYREKDVGKALLSSLQRFGMGLHLTPDELKSAEAIEQNCSKHLSVVNDIYSFDKELRQSEVGHHEGSVLCTAVKVLADESNLSFEAAKRVLWYMCREWELVHQRLESRLKVEGDCSEDLAAYIKGLEFQMSGNEKWSETTLRYHSPN